MVASRAAHWMVLPKAAGWCLVHKRNRLGQFKTVYVSLQLAVKLLEVRGESSLLNFCKGLGELKLDLLDGARVFFVVFLVEEIVDISWVKGLDPFLDDQGLVEHLNFTVLLSIWTRSANFF